MSQISGSQTTIDAVADPRTTGARARPPVGSTGPVGWARANLFGTWWSTAITLLLGYVILRVAVSLLLWGVVNAVWTVPYSPKGVPDTTICQNAKGFGACWAILPDKYRLILLGRYPYDQQWRPAICVLLFIGLYCVSAMRRFWRKELSLIWIGTLVIVGVLMWEIKTKESEWLVGSRTSANKCFPILSTIGRRSSTVQPRSVLLVLLGGRHRGLLLYLPLLLMLRAAHHLVSSSHLLPSDLSMLAADLIATKLLATKLLATDLLAADVLVALRLAHLSNDLLPDVGVRKRQCASPSDRLRSAYLVPTDLLLAH